MPRFYFNVYDSGALLDTEGTELADYTEARVEAVAFAAELLKQQSTHVRLGEDWHMEVADVGGTVLCQLDFKITDMVASLRERKALAGEVEQASLAGTPGC